MTDKARREAAEWHILLDEAPDDLALCHRFREWLDADRRHVDAWHNLSQTVLCLTDLGETDLTEIHRESLSVPKTGSPLPNNPPMRSGHRLRMTFLMLAAAVMMAVGLLKGPSAYLDIIADVTTSVAEIRELELDDGSKVTLEPRSAISVRYEAGHRVVELHAGAAFFSVQPDPDRPFTVVAGDLSTTVLGTSFSVGRWPGTTSVEVERGRVRVSRPGPSGPEQSVLQGGAWLQARPNMAFESGKADPALMGGGQPGRMKVRGMLVRDVILRIEPWYPGEIFLLDEGLASQRVTGFYDLRDPAAALNALVSPYGGSVLQLTPWALIVTGTR